MAEKRPYFELEPLNDGYTVEGLRESYEDKINKRELDSAVDEQRVGDLKVGEQTEDASRKEKQFELEQNKRTLEIQKYYQVLTALDENPEQVVALLSFKDSIDQEDKNVVETKLNLDSEPFKLEIDLKSVGTKLEVVDGKVCLDTEGMDAQKMHDTIAFLEQHGLVYNDENLEIKNADEQTQACFDEAQEMFEEGADKEESVEGLSEDSPHKVDDNDDGIPSEDIEQLRQSANSNSVGFQGFATNDGFSDNKSKSDTAPKNVLKAANKSVEGWCDRNKRRRYSWFKGSTVLGGWDTYTIYPGEDRNQNIKPVTRDKHGKIRVNYEFKVYTRMRNGKLEVCYTCPPGKNLTDDQADLIAGIFEDAGIKYVDFKAMTNPNQAVMRTACAKKLLVPTNHKLDQERFDKMVNAAGGKNDPNGPKLYAYKKDLALQMANYLQTEKGIDWRNPANKNNPSCRRIRWAIGAYELHPFRDLWEDFGLRSAYEKRLAAGSPSDPQCTDLENGAVKVIGAKMAVNSLFEMFSNNASKDVKHLLSAGCKELTKEEKAALRVFANDTGLKLDTKVRDMPPASLLTIYDAMCKTQESVVTQDLEEEYLNIARRNHENGSKDDPEAGAISAMFSRANTMITGLNDQLVDYNLPQIFLARKDTPKYDFAAAKEEAERRGYRYKTGKGRGGSKTNPSYLGTNKGKTY